MTIPSNLSIDFKFSKPLPEAVNVVYTEYRSTTEVNKSKRAFKDF